MSLSQIQLQSFGNDNDELSYEKMEEDLTCPVCLELYADPLMMPCSHSVCKACLHEIRASRQKFGQTDFECPTCRDKHPLTSEQLDSFPKNLALENIVFRYQEIKSSSLVKRGQASTSFKQPADAVDVDGTEETDNVFEQINEDSQCGMCDEETPNRADWFCPQCQVLYCQRCLDLYHPRRGSLGRHKICKPTYQDGPRNNFPCPEHAEEKVSIFCDTCQAVACHLCVCKGQGSHGTHVILDLETAHNQIESAVSKAKEELTSLVSVFTLKDKELESQLEIVKSVKDMADSHIQSQYQCILSDVAATLSLVKHKFTDNLTSSLNEHVQKLHSKSRNTKVSLERCQKLRETCQLVMTCGENASLPGLSPSSKAEGKLSISEQRAAHDLSGSSLEGSFMDPSLVLEEDGGDKLSSSRTGGSREKSSCKEEFDCGKYGANAKNVVSTDLKGDEKHRIKLRADTQRMKTSTPSLFSGAIDNDKSDPHTTHPSRRQSSITINSDNENDQDDKLNRSLVEERKRYADRQNSERKLSEKQSDTCFGRSESSGRRSETLSVSSICNEDSQLLMQGKVVGSLLEEIKSLTKEHQQSGTYEEEALNEITKTAWGSVSDFGWTSLTLLSELSDVGKEEMDIPSIIPPVRSSMSPVSPNQKGLPRVQSRVLLTWGFNSTSFTAEPIVKSAQWTVTVARNTSHIGDVHSGYLFGVGVAKRSLASKEQVGMNADSYGIICFKGSLAFCHDSQVSPIMPLPDLPLAIRLSLFSGVRSIVFCYSLLLNTSAGAVQGRRVVSLLDGSVTDDDPSPEGSKRLVEHCEMFPVFTVTQRVKMQFPLTSDV